MGTFTVLDDADVAAIAHAFDLGPVSGWRAIAAGTINSNFAVTAGGARWFVRVNEGKTVDDVAWEAALCRHLAGQAPVPVPRLTRDGAAFATHRGLLVSAFAWLPGEHREAVSIADARATGRRGVGTQSASTDGTWLQPRNTRVPARGTGPTGKCPFPPTTVLGESP